MEMLSCVCAENACSCVCRRMCLCVYLEVRDEPSCLCRGYLFICVQTHVTLCLSGGQRLAFMCAEDVCSYVYSCMCLCVCVEPESGLYVCAEGCLFICVRLHVPLCVSGARDQSWVLCVPQEPSTFFFSLKKKKIFIINCLYR